MGSGKEKSWQYTKVLLVYLITLQKKTGHWILYVWQDLGQEGAGQFVWSGEESFIKVPSDFGLNSALHIYQLQIQAH